MHLLLICWKQAELAARAAGLSRLGYNVGGYSDEGPDCLDALAGPPTPSAILIDLEHLPGDGRMLARLVRERSDELPIVFVGGDAEEAQRDFAQAHACTWASVEQTLASVVGPPPDPFEPKHVDDESLWNKLGLIGGGMVALIDEPHDFEIGAVPPGVFLKHGARGVADRVLFFARTRLALEGRRMHMTPMMRDGHSQVWIAWPKHASGIESDLGVEDVLVFGHHLGLVEGPTASLDERWMAICFERRST